MSSRHSSKPISTCLPLTATPPVSDRLQPILIGSALLAGIVQASEARPHKPIENTVVAFMALPSRLLFLGVRIGVDEVRGLVFGRPQDRFVVGGAVLVHVARDDMAELGEEAPGFAPLAVRVVAD